MRLLLNHTEMMHCDRSTIDHYGLPAEVLMERAALAVRDAAIEHFGPKRVLVLCGSGNNGGDGFAAARLLLVSGISAEVFFLGRHDAMTDSCRLQARVFQAYGGRILPDLPALSGFDLIIDALFGIGLSREVLGRYADLIDAVNRSGALVLSVDIPSGISADDGQILGTAIQADLTVTFQFPKLGQKLFPGEASCGKLLVADVGITDCLTGGFHTENPADPPVYTLDAGDLPDLLPPRSPSDNKATHGKLLIVAGNTGMAGAAILCGKAALRAGAGMVAILTHPDNRLAVQSALPEAIFVPWPAEADLTSVTRHSRTEGSWPAPAPSAEGSEGTSDTVRIDRWISWADALAIGPGLGTDHYSLLLLSYLLDGDILPAVYDADALNLMASHPHLLSGLNGSSVLTPHPGEMTRLLSSDLPSEGEDRRALIQSSGFGTDQVAKGPVPIAKAYAKKEGITLVLKGPRTVVTNGTEVMLNTCGNEGMATAGSGDSLTGIIGSLLAQGLPAFAAARTGVLLHALAGDAAARRLGTRSMKAGDLSDALPDVLQGIL